MTSFIRYLFRYVLEYLYLGQTCVKMSLLLVDWRKGKGLSYHNFMGTVVYQTIDYLLYSTNTTIIIFHTLKFEKLSSTMHTDWAHIFFHNCIVTSLHTVLTTLQACLNENADSTPHEDLPVFIKSFMFISDVTIKLDYRGKQCDMGQGVMGMMLGVASLTGSVVTLKAINCQKGILGWDKLFMFAANEWLNDIRSRQIHSILRGVGSFSIVCQIIQGMMDLVRLPIQQYQKDGRIIRGVQRGANSFTLNTVMAILELTNKVVGSIQYCAELGYDMMSPGPSVRRKKIQRSRTRQPRTTAEGAKYALQVMTDGFKDCGSTMTAVMSEESAHKGIVGVVGATMRTAGPECVLKPIALLAQAGSSLAQAARNELDPNVRKEDEDRWK